MMEKPLDDFDLRIIRAVQADARLTHQALSSRSAFRPPSASGG